MTRYEVRFDALCDRPEPTAIVRIDDRGERTVATCQRTAHGNQSKADDLTRAINAMHQFVINGEPVEFVTVNSYTGTEVERFDMKEAMGI